VEESVNALRLSASRWPTAETTVPINVRWQDETGEILGRHSGFIAADLVWRAAPSTACVRFIDPYGDTTFNQHQLPVLIQEFEALAEQVDSPGRESIRDLLLFLRRATDQVHTYIKFVGD
jgi:hypothetical protein